MNKYLTPFLVVSAFCVSLIGLTQRAVAHEHEYSGVLTGPGGATGTVDMLIDLDLVTLDVDLSFSGLSSPTTTAFIHGQTALPYTGTAIQALPLPAFPSGVTSGTSSDFIDLTIAPSYMPGFITASGGTVSDALNALAFGLEDGKMYIQINTTGSPSGALSGFLVPVLPEPATLGCLGVIGMLLLKRSR